MMQVLGKIYDHRRSDSWATSLRKQRLNLFKSLVTTLPTPIKMLDVGGSVSFWESTDFLSEEFKDIKITVLNTNIPKFRAAHPSIKQVIGDARNREQFQVQEFDVVFSNSVIEHVGNYHEQRRMANEVMRVGKRYFVQTPNLYFPIEPHFIFPFFQFLPVDIRVGLLTHFQLGWHTKVSNKQKALDIVNQIRLLGKKEITALFPGARLYEEKILGLTKSLIVYDGWEFLLTRKKGWI
jgi:Methyltransferase domain